MCFVKNRNANRRKQFRNPRLTHGQICEKKMMVDHHYVGCQGFAPGQVDMARTKLWALRPKAILPSRGDQWNKGRSFIKTSELSQITGTRNLCPLFYFRQRKRGAMISNAAVVTSQRHAMQTKIAGTPF